MTVKTTAGSVELAHPKLRGTDPAFASRQDEAVAATMEWFLDRKPAEC